MKLSRFRHRRPHAGIARAAPAAGLAVLASAAAPGGRDRAVPADVPAGEAQPDRWSGDGAAWLSRARGFWQHGDWPALASLDPRSLQRHPDRARLTLLAAAGHFQLGDAAATRRCVRQAMEWGCDKRLVSQALVSGLHNTLGRAASVLDQPERALTHFAAAIATGSPGSALRAVTQARGSAQLAQLGLASLVQPAPALQPPGVPAPASSATQASPAVPPPLALQAVARQALGSCTLAAAAPLRPVALVRGDSQWLAFAAGPRLLRLVQRQLPDGPLVSRDLEIDLDLRSPGAALALGLDRQGHLHLAYDSVSQGSCYRRSTSPGSVRQWSAAWPLPGATASRAGLRQFAGGHDGRALQLVVQPDIGSGHLALWAFDEDGQSWAHRDAVPAQTRAPLGLACLVADDGTLHLALALPAAAAAAVPGRDSPALLVHAQRATVDGAWRVTPLPLAPGLGAPGPELALAADGKQLHLLCGTADAADPAWWCFTHRDGAWQAQGVPGLLQQDLPLLLPTGLGFAGLVRCSPGSQHRVQLRHLGPEPGELPPGPSLQFCRGQALAAMALPPCGAARPGFTLLVHEAAPADDAAAAADTGALALHDVLLS